MEDRRDARRYDVLDALRGVAALTVVFGHATRAALAGHSLVPRKTLAVVFFFELSGFVLSAAYARRLALGLGFVPFMLRRVIRLYPLIGLATVLGSAWFAATGAFEGSGRRGIAAIVGAALALPTLPTTFSFGFFPVLPPEWSLFFEMIVSALFGAGLGAARFSVLVAVLAVSGTVYAAAQLAHPEGVRPLLIVFEAIATFTTGVLIWRAHASDRLTLPPLPVPLLAVVVVAPCLCPMRFGPLPSLVAAFVVFPVVIAAGAAAGRRPASITERALGGLSYPLYILHWPFLLAADRFVRPAFGPVASITVTVAGAVAASALALVFFDRPVRTALARRFNTDQSREYSSRARIVPSSARS